MQRGASQLGRLEEAAHVHRHQRVVKQRVRLIGWRIHQPDEASVGDVGRAAELPEQHRGTKRMVIRQQRQE
jgi:hypothetical protein